MTKLIANAKLDRVAESASYATKHGVFGFGCNHSMLLINRQASKDEKEKAPRFDNKWDLLFDGRAMPSMTKSAALYLLGHCAPDLIIELINGYRYAKEHGYEPGSTQTNAAEPARDVVSGPSST